jgi:hypothetical protein
MNYILIIEMEGSLICRPDDLPMAVVDAVATSPVIYYVHTDHLGRPWR